MELFDILTFDHITVENVPITTTDPDWTDLISLTTPQRAAGIYSLSFSLQFTMNSTSRSFMYRFSLDGGATWGHTYYKESKDKTDTQVIELFNLLDLATAQVIDVRCQVTREATADCEVVKGIIACERKK
jgi:hypothetical protein